MFFFFQIIGQNVQNNVIHDKFQFISNKVIRSIILYNYCLGYFLADTVLTIYLIFLIEEHILVRQIIT